MPESVPKVDAYFLKEWKGNNTAIQAEHTHKCPVCGKGWKCRLALHREQADGLKYYLDKIAVDDREPCMADLSTSCAHCPGSGVLHG